MIKLFRFTAILFLLGSALALPAARRAITFRVPVIKGQPTASTSAKAVCFTTPQSSAQDAKGFAGQSSGARATGAVSPTVTVTDHKMTAGPIPDQCATPVAKFNFVSTDSVAYQWSLLSGVQTGDVIQWQFIQPNGSIYGQPSQFTVNFNGNGCLWPSIAIAGQSPATLLGNWQARVFYNGTQILTENFTVNASPSAVTITDRRMTGTTPANDCTPPPTKTNFAPTDQTASLWVSATGANTGDVVRWEFVQPNGSVYTQSQLTLTISGSVCFWSGINIAGQQAASLLGNWQVRLFYNGTQLLTENFTISTSACPTIASISPASGAVGSAVTINGTNFTGVSAVKFSNNVTAQFNVVSATQITATVPSGATTGAITISKPNCAD